VLTRLLRVPSEVCVLAGLAMLTRFLWLTRPRAIVFDEVYFRDAALRYADGSYYFDPHPPLAKLILAGWAKLIGVDATHSVPEGAVPTPESLDPAVALRVIPALAGAALIVVVYYFLKELGAGRKVATLGAGALLLDNALALESRLILLDSMLLFFGMAGLTVFLAARRSTGRRHWVLLTVAALLIGMCVSTKVTGLCILGVAGLIGVVTTIAGRVSWRRWLPQAAVLLVVPFAVFFGSYAVHTPLLPNTGDGDRFMSEEFQATLEGNPLYDPGASMGPVASFWEMQKATHDYEKALEDRTHPYQSEWTVWPVEKRSIYYYLGPEEEGGKNRYLYLIGNPVVWWGTLIGVLVTALAWIAMPALYRPHRRRLAMLAVAYAGSYLPFGLIDRPMFLYHYFFPLLFSLAFAVYGIGVLARWVPDGSEDPGWCFRSRLSAGAYGGILLATLLVFLWFSPLTYGFPLTENQLQDRMWLDSWR
jgi:dolichyl-phosphate-mannose-protein mannosyltransferase